MASMPNFNQALVDTMVKEEHRNQFEVREMNYTI